MDADAMSSPMVFSDCTRTMSEAIEYTKSSMITLRFTLEKGRVIPAPQFSTPAPLTPRVDSAPFYGTTGVNADLFVADFAGTFARSLDDFSAGLNTGKHETGPDFWRAPP